MGLGAVVAYEPAWADEFVFLQIIAVSLALQGERIGDEAMKEFGDVATEEGIRRGLGRVRLEGKCSPDNDPSLKMLSRWAWRYTGRADDRYQIFESELIIEGAHQDTE